MRVKQGSHCTLVHNTLTSVAQSCPTLCNPMDCSTTGFLSITNSRVDSNFHWVADAIQPSHPLSSPSSPAFNLSQGQGLLKGASSSYQINKVLEFQLQHQSFQWIFSTDFLYNVLLGIFLLPRDSQESSPTLQFKSINSSVLRFLYSPSLTSIRDNWKA